MNAGIFKVCDLGQIFVVALVFGDQFGIILHPRSGNAVGHANGPVADRNRFHGWRSSRLVSRQSEIKDEHVAEQRHNKGLLNA